MLIENKHTFEQAVAAGLNLFLGAGFSVLAKDKQGRPLPTGAEFADELRREFDIGDEDSGLSLAQICTLIERQKRREFRAFVKSRFTVGRFDARYNAIADLPIKSVFTTNVDSLLYRIYATSSTHYLNDLDIKGPTFNDRTAIDIVTLHGSVEDDARPMTFSELDLAAAFRTDPDRWYFLTQRIQAFPTLFWGYGLADSATLEALSPRSVKERPHKDKWLVLHPSAPTDVERFYKALDFQIIRGDTNAVLDYVQQVAPSKPKAAVTLDSRRTKDLFPQEAIPDIGSVPVRPILDFYLGAAPSWHDIFAGRIYRTSHFTTIRDAIFSGKNTVVVGLPACGKSTLLMQVAQDISFSGHKLVCQSPSLEKVRQIVTRAAGDRVLVFIDNFADSVEAFEYLAQHRNITLAGFDRDYTFDNVAHRIDREGTKILDVTGLTEIDTDEILARIPDNIRNAFSRKPQVAEGSVPSLFELIECNIKMPSLHERFRAVLDDLEGTDPNLCDLVLACCYVHRCRTPVSMDMLIAFFRDRVAEYQEIYRMCRNVGSILSDYVGALADEEQDYFVPRSTIVSEAIMDQAPGDAIRRMLTQFHSEVSPYRIHRYDILKRKAYDWELMARAYPNWHDGMSFYEAAHARDPSPQLRQQGALYLAQKRRFTESFDWIDEAIMESGGRNPSIRNSHAIILFKANIGRPETDGTVQRTLKHSMDILADCYDYDKRKAYHCVVFADQALRYWDVYEDKAARGYLATAERWLEDERRRSPWNRAVRRCLPAVKRKLATT